MKTNLVVEINCGEKTCASEPGKFCKYFGSKKYGQIPVCTLFPDEKDNTRFYTELYAGPDKDGNEGMGWTMRCKACLEANKIKGDN